jgi:hypothetical protein
MNFDKWIDDLKKARKSQNEKTIHHLLRRSDQAADEGGYTRIEYLAHSARTFTPDGLILGGGAF